MFHLITFRRNFEFFTTFPKLLMLENQPLILLNEKKRIPFKSRDDNTTESLRKKDKIITILRNAEIKVYKKSFVEDQDFK